MSTAATTPAELQQKLKQVQGTVKALDTQRERLLRESSVEEHKVKESRAKLAELGVADVEKLTVDQLKALREATQAELTANLAEVETKIEEANAVMAEYTQAVGE